MSGQSGRRKPRASSGASQRSGMGASNRSFVSDTSEFPAGRKPRASVVQGGDFPEGRTPRGSVVMEEDFPEGRKPRGSVYVDETEIIDEHEVNEADEEEEKKKRKRIACLIACCLTLILIIVIIVILVNVLGTSDAGNNAPNTGVPDDCVASNETKPVTYDEYVCDLITTLTKKDSSTYLKTYPTTSAYGMTIGWMTKQDTTDFSNTAHEYIMERFIMVLFYFMTGGKDWFTKFSFLTQDHLCDWTGDSKNAIRCAYATDKKVTDLGLPQNGLTGPIPTELGFLTELTRLYFSINSLTGNIPTELFQLTKLQLLYLDRNDLKGKIPTQINQLTKLRTLHLENSDFNGDLSAICDMAEERQANNATEFDFFADCTTGRVTCPCCETCY